MTGQRRGIRIPRAVSGASPASLMTLLVCAWLASAGGGSAKELGRLSLFGVRLGTAPNAVDTQLVARGAVAAAPAIRRSVATPGADGGQTYVQRLFYDLPDGRVLQIVFSDPTSGNRAVEVTLTDPRAADGADVRAATERDFGPPAQVVPIAEGQGFIAAWNGTAETQGGIRPLRGAAETLRLEFAPGAGSSLRLTDHAELSTAGAGGAEETDPAAEALGR